MANNFKLLEQATDCRDLARRVRLLAATFDGGQASERILGYADDLDELANNLEREIGVTGAVWDLIARIGRRSVSG
jgi:hypothetical protein